MWLTISFQILNRNKAVVDTDVSGYLFWCPPTDNPGQPTGGHRTSHRSSTCGHDTFRGGQAWTTGGHHKIGHYWLEKPLE